MKERCDICQSDVLVNSDQYVCDNCGKVVCYDCIGHDGAWMECRECTDEGEDE